MQFNEVCDRCGRSEEIGADTDELILRIQEKKAVQENAAKIAEFIQNEIDGPLPEVTVINSNKVVTVMDHLCSSNGGKRKGCGERVATLIRDIFLDHPKKEDEG